MATTREKFVEKCEVIVKAKPAYKLGCSSTTECDCIGMVKYGLHKNGVEFTTSGTNWTFRNQVEDIRTIHSANDLKFGGVVFRPEKKLLRKLSTTKFQKVTYSQTSTEISDIEIDGLLAVHFKDHAYITTKEMQHLCGLSNHTALRRLKERVAEGKLTHPGHLRSAFYFPVPGNYGVSGNKISD